MLPLLILPQYLVMVKRLTVILLCICISHVSSGQRDSSWHYDIGYSGGNFVHPGITIGAIKTIKIDSRKKKNGKTLNKLWGIGARSGIYSHKEYNTGYWLQSEVQHSRRKKETTGHRYSLGLGWLRTRIPEVYKISSAGQIEKKYNKGLNYFLSSLSYEKYWNLSRPWNNWISGIYIRPRIQLLFPYFQGSSQYFLFELGFNF